MCVKKVTFKFISIIY